jgi:Fe2+ transport system protein FeoA
LARQTQKSKIKHLYDRPILRWHLPTKAPRAMHTATIQNQPSAPLSRCVVGSQNIVTEVAGTSPLSTRLRELGLLPGVRVRVLRAGSSLVIQIGETRLAVRRDDADAIRVCDDTAFGHVASAHSIAS